MNNNKDLNIELQLQELRANLRAAEKTIQKQTAEKRQAEKRLIKSSSLLQATLDSSINGILVVDVKGRIVSFNRRFTDLWKIPQSILELKDDDTALEYVVKQLRNPDGFLKKVRKLYNHPEAESLDIIEFKDGRIFERYSMPQYVNGKIVGRVWSFWDITKSRQTETALRKSEERYRALYEEVPSMYFTVHPDGKVISVNKYGAEQLGYTADELVGQPVLKVVYREDQEIVTNQIKQFVENPSPIQRWQFRKIRKDGSMLWVEEFARPITDQNGETNILIVCQDMTSRVAMEEALKESEERFRNLLEKIPEAVSVLSTQMKVVYFNKSYTELLGYSIEERAGKSSRDIWHPDDYPRACARVKEIMEGGTEYPSEYKVIRKDGKITPVEIFSRKIIYDGKPALLSVFRDLTERKKAESAIKQYQEHLEELVEERTARLQKTNQQLEDEITERKSTEVKLKNSREELRHLSAYLETAREEERKWIAREIHDELGQALSVLKMDVNWLIEYFPKHKVELFEKTDNMSQVISETIQKVRQISQTLRPDILDNLGIVSAITWQAKDFQERSGIKCQLFIDDEDKIVLTEDLSNALFRVFQEALTNVFRHAQATEITVRLRKNENKLYLDIQDNGIGISPEQISSPSSFGLIGIRERISFLNGTVKISGEANKGTSISVSVPV